MSNTKYIVSLLFTPTLVALALLTGWNVLWTILGVIVFFVAMIMTICGAIFTWMVAKKDYLKNDSFDGVETLSNLRTYISLTVSFVVFLVLLWTGHYTIALVGLYSIATAHAIHYWLKNKIATIKV